MKNMMKIFTKLKTYFKGEPMSLSTLVQEMDTVIHAEVAKIKTQAQGMVTTIDSSNVTVSSALNDSVQVLNGLKEVFPRVFTLYPELGVLVNTLQSTQGAPLEVGAVYNALKAFLLPTQGSTSAGTAQQAPADTPPTE